MAENNNGLLYGGFLGVPTNSHSLKKATEKSKRTKTLNFYEEKMNAKELISNMIFSQSERSEGVFFFQDGVKILLPKEEMQQRYNDVMVQGLARMFTVKVIHIDREKGIVKVSLIQAQEAVRPEVLKQINKNLLENRVFFTQARIMHITSTPNSTCFVDILGLGIRGVIWAKDWSTSYVKDITMLTKVGEIIDIAITGTSPKYSEEIPQYLCSRKLTLNDDPWKDIENRAPHHSKVIVECVHKDTKSFLGKIKGLEELTVYCQYPDDGTLNSETGEAIVIKKGGKYAGYISRVCEERKILRVRILDELPNFLE